MNNKKRVKFICISGVILLVILIGLYLYSISNEKGQFISINYEQLEDKIEKKDSFVLVVSSSFCSHCAEYKPKVKNVAEDYGINIYYTDINLYSEEDSLDFNSSFGIDGTPITLFFIDGQEESVMSRINGDVSEDKLVSSLRKYKFID